MQISSIKAVRIKDIDTKGAKMFSPENWQTLASL